MSSKTHHQTTVVSSGDEGAFVHEWAHHAM